eukprot:CAMPEP_0174244640 /NCGR_PEP_ID=MMETSP0417-20130205/35954_1 /TAXON_ID=242541 /ORGANISM="Mayorella sp, Strain BSH-02190019" /LENGTH=247 /DNA_ID=CAMNT_0015324345 /DNA_START=74 /DNA_END=817 /DNA_ORIENTATION=-
MADAKWDVIKKSLQSDTPVQWVRVAADDVLADVQTALGEPTVVALSAFLSAPPADASTEGIWVCASPSQLTNDTTLATTLKSLQANGKLVLCTADASVPTEAVADAALFGGFSSPQVQGCAVLASRPSWDLGAKDQIKKPAAVSAWTLDGDDLVEEEFIDDADLLSAEDLAKPAKPDDCEMTGGTRKACKNCSCGRAEEEAAASASKPQEAKSSCGNCYLGDAFRCASCPYLGKPAFKPGEKVQLEL